MSLDVLGAMVWGIPLPAQVLFSRERNTSFQLEPFDYLLQSIVELHTFLAHHLPRHQPVSLVLSKANDVRFSILILFNQRDLLRPNYRLSHSAYLAK